MRFRVKAGVAVRVIVWRSIARRGWHGQKRYHSVVPHPSERSLMDSSITLMWEKIHKMPNRKVNASKTFIGLVVVVLLVVGSWATTTAIRIPAPKSVRTTTPRVALAPPVCPANIPQSVCDTFEVEGNAVDDSGAGLPEDWNSIISSSDANGVLPQGQLSGPSGGASPRIYIDDTGVADQIFTTGGSKDANSLSGWRHTIGSVPDKDEILHGGAAAYTDAVTGHRILAFFADRFDNS